MNSVVHLTFNSTRLGLPHVEFTMLNWTRQHVCDWNGNNDILVTKSLYAVHT